MKQTKTLVSTAAALSVFAFAANASPTVEAPKESCSNLEWSPAFLKDYPKAPVACREVTVKDGVKFAKFNGKVSKVGHHFVQVEISDVADIPVSTIAFQIGTGGHITMADKVVMVRDLKVGDQLTFWVREAQFGISPTLTDKPMAIIKPEAMSAN
jgi:hypothetical protein